VELHDRVDSFEVFLPFSRASEFFDRIIVDLTELGVDELKFCFGGVGIRFALVPSVVLLFVAF
jgi:hypothetical protein